MTQEERERAALKIFEIIKPALKQIQPMGWMGKVYQTKWGYMTDIRLVSAIEKIIEEEAVKILKGEPIK